MDNVIDLDAHRKRRAAESHPLQTTFKCGCGEYMWMGTEVFEDQPDERILVCLGCTAIISLADGVK